ncbi:hypothetical protein Pla144_45130 [Bythopirellula polymerisocia]|uniref:Uncharacterized protein n=1 Tax=Bythopirellula polymerisocia TaxID=2528003 RepID=A0A5C6CDJ4_9BACT|nr:hypothetical protein Pla144_45130 [Bythopirellula polymerisocia]
MGTTVKLQMFVSPGEKHAFRFLSTTLISTNLLLGTNSIEVRDALGHSPEATMFSS